MYDIFKQQGLINLDDYIDPHSDDWYKISIVYSNGFKTSIFSNGELQNILSNAYKEFLIYKLFSIQTYINILRKIKSFEDIIYAQNLMTVPIKMLLKMMLGKGLSNVSIREPRKELRQQNC